MKLIKTGIVYYKSYAQKSAATKLIVFLNLPQFSLIYRPDARITDINPTADVQLIVP